MRLFYFFKINHNCLIHKKFNIFDFCHEKADLFLWFMFFSILYYHLIWCSSTIIVEPCKITVWRLQSAKVPNYACPVVCLYRCCNEIENLYTDFESCISVIADSRNYDYEINGYIWIVTLLLWVFFVMIFNLRYC